MVVFDHAAKVLSCPTCGCSDVERVGRVAGKNSYLCLEGHRFEAPRHLSVFGRRREKKNRPK